MLLVPALIAALIFYITVLLLTMALMRVRTALTRTFTLIAIMAACLVLAVKKHSKATYGTDLGYLEWLVRVADQGHVKAAYRLSQDSRIPAERQRWLTQAAEGGVAAAQYQIHNWLHCEKTVLIR